MKAYKIWYDTKYFIHKSTINELNVTWTTDIKDAKDTGGRTHLDQKGYTPAVKFYEDTLGFNVHARYDTLHYMPVKELD